MADNEIKSLVEGIARDVTDMRQQVEAVKGADYVTTDKLQKAADAITAQVADLQAKQARIEAASQRMDAPQEAKDKGRADVDAFLRKGTLPSGINVTADGVEIKSMATNDNAGGGFLVRPALADFVVTQIREISNLRRLGAVMNIGGGALDILIDDNYGDAQWTNQGTGGTATNPPLIGRKSVVAHKMTSKQLLTTEMLEDSILDVEGWMIGKAAEAFAYREGVAFTNGDGVGKPRGFTTYPAWAAAGVYERDKIERINTGAATNVAVSGLIAAQNSLKEGYQSGASWAMTRATFGQVLQLKSADNYNFLSLSVAPGNQNLTMQILGKGVTFLADMAQVGAGNVVAAYADWRRFYTIFDRMGLQILRDPFSNSGFVTYTVSKRVGGDVTSFDAGKLLVCAA